MLSRSPASSAWRSAQNRRLRQRHISSCLHCNNCWGVVEIAVIPYAEGLGMFPVCVECFNDLDTYTIIGYCSQLVNKWVAGGMRKKYPDYSDPVAIKLAAAQAVRGMKTFGKPILPSYNERGERQ